MPFIHIVSLPFASALDTKTIIQEISHDFAEATGITIAHLTVSWQFLAAGHYVIAGKAAEVQPMDSHPILVDFLTPDFHAAEQIENMLRAIAASIGKRANTPVHNVFINHRVARSGHVFDGGQVVSW